MVQDQLVDYVSSQLKLGVARTAISAALVSAGWVAGDVEDTLKKVEAKPAGAAGSAMPATAGAVGAAGAAGMAGAKPASTGPQMIKVADLVSSSGSFASSSGGSSAATKSSPTMTGAMAKPVASSPMTSPSRMTSPISSASSPATTSMKSASGMPAGGKAGTPMMKIISIVLIVVFAGIAGYLFWLNSDLAAKVASLNGANSTLNSQVASVQSQFDTAQAALSAQIQSLKAANDDLTLNLSFYVGTPNASATPITVGGLLGGGNGVRYAITTPRGAAIFVTNATPAKVLAALKPFVGNVVQVSGTYVPGTDQMTVATILSPTPAPPSPKAAATQTTPSSSVPLQK